jgi:hypothetical protein
MLWIISLSFSIAGAIDSQLAYYWIRHSHRTPNPKMTALGSLLIVRAPLVFFVVAAVAFSGGLIAFGFLKFGSSAVYKVVVACASITIGAMVLVIFWLAREKSELLWLTVAASVAAVKNQIPSWFTAIFSRRKQDPLVGGASGSETHDLESGPQTMDAEGALELASFEQVYVPPRGQWPPPQAYPARTVGAAFGPIIATSTASGAPAVPSHVLAVTGNQLDSEGFTLDERAEVGRASTVWGLPTPTDPPSTSHLESPHSDNSPYVVQRSSVHPENPSPTREVFPLRIIQEALRRDELSICASKARPYTFPVRHIEFSPDGLFLASFTWDKSVAIWKLEPHPRTSLRLLGYCRGSLVVNDIAWCPDSASLRFIALHGEVITLWQVEVRKYEFLTYFVIIFLLGFGKGERNQNNQTRKLRTSHCLDARWKSACCGERIWVARNCARL